MGKKKDLLYFDYLLYLNLRLQRLQKIPFEYADVEALAPEPNSAELMAYNIVIPPPPSIIPPLPRHKGNFQATLGQSREKHRKNSHLINHCPTSLGVSKVSERVSAARE